MMENLWWLLVPVLMCGAMMGGMALLAFLGLRRRPTDRAPGQPADLPANDRGEVAQG